MRAATKKADARARASRLHRLTRSHSGSCSADVLGSRFGAYYTRRSVGNSHEITRPHLHYILPTPSRVSLCVRARGRLAAARIFAEVRRARGVCTLYLAARGRTFCTHTHLHQWSERKREEESWLVRVSHPELQRRLAAAAAACFAPGASSLTPSCAPFPCPSLAPRRGNEIKRHGCARGETRSHLGWTISRENIVASPQGREGKRAWRGLVARRISSKHVSR